MPPVASSTVVGSGSPVHCAWSRSDVQANTFDNMSPRARTSWNTGNENAGSRIQTSS